MNDMREDSAVNMRRTACPQHGERIINLDSPESAMCPDCRIVGDDGKPLGWQDGRPTATGAASSGDPQWVEQMTKKLDEAPDILTAVHLAMGAASMCWEHVERAGVFESDRASVISELLHRRVTLGAVNWTP
jgi:hypothetical protein